MWTARKKDNGKCEGCNHLATFPVACVTCQNLILEQNPQTACEADVCLNNLLTGNKVLRELLWLTHKCGGLYGDDGERQCTKCKIDFKRDSPEDIKAKLIAC